MDKHNKMKEKLKKAALLPLVRQKSHKKKYRGVRREVVVAVGVPFRGSTTKPQRGAHFAVSWQWWVCAITVEWTAWHEAGDFDGCSRALFRQGACMRDTVVVTPKHSTHRHQSFRRQERARAVQAFASPRSQSRRARKRKRVRVTMVRLNSFLRRQTALSFFFFFSGLSQLPIIFETHRP